MTACSVLLAHDADGGYRCPSTPVQAGRCTTRRRTVGRSHSMRWERASGGQKTKVSVTSLDQVSSKARKRALKQHRRGARQHHRAQGGTGTQGQNPPQGGGSKRPLQGGTTPQGGGPPGGHTTAGGTSTQGGRSHPPTDADMASRDNRDSFAYDSVGERWSVYHAGGPTT